MHGCRKESPSLSQFSESGGSFSSDNYTSNELMIGQVATDLISRGKTGGAYIGVGPEQNFTYIAATRPEIAFIVDIRRQAVMQHLMYKAIFEMSANRGEFIARLFSKPVQPLAAQTPRSGTSGQNICVWSRTPRCIAAT